MNNTPMKQHRNTTQLYLIRHGATDANLKQPYVLQGQGVDMSLNSTGRNQAAALGRFLSDHSFSQIYCSPLRRACETAEAVSTHHDVEVRPIDELAECDVGRWDGMDWDTIRREHPGAYRAFMDDPANNGYLDGESYGDVLRRARPIIADLLERHLGQSIAIVAHNIVNRVYLSSLLGLDLCQAKDIRQSNACVNVIRHQNGETALITMNAFFHLDISLQ